MVKNPFPKVIAYVVQYKRIYVFLYITFTILWWGFVFSSFRFEFGFLYLIPFAILFSGLYFFFLELEETFLMKFAEHNNYSFSKEGELSLLEGSVFKQGHSHRMRNVVRGMYHNNQFQLFTFAYTLGYDKNAKHYSSTVFELDFDKPLPHMILVSRPRFLSLVSFDGIFPMNTERKEKLVLEGNFQDYFTLYTDPKWKLESLEIFTPDVMADFIDYGKDYSVEFVDDKIYIIYGSIVTEEKEFATFYELMRLVTERINFVLAKKKFDWIA